MWFFHHHNPDPKKTSDWRRVVVALRFVDPNNELLPTPSIMVPRFDWWCRPMVSHEFDKQSTARMPRFKWQQSTNGKLGGLGWCFGILGVALHNNPFWRGSQEFKLPTPKPTLHHSLIHNLVLYPNKNNIQLPVACIFFHVCVKILMGVNLFFQAWKTGFQGQCS